MHGVQIPLDAADGQPPLFPQRGDQAEQVDAEALLAQDHAVQYRRRCAAPSARRASPSKVDVLGDLHRNHRQLDDFRSALGPAVPRQLYLPVGVNQFCRFTSLAWPRCWAALVPVAGDVKLQDDGVVHDPVNRRGGGHGVGKDALPLREDQV